MIAHALVFLFIVNAWTMLRFNMDKRYAHDGLRRVPERDLLALAFIGGSPGALLARRLFRHKTRKEPFSSRLWSIVAIQVVALGAAIGFALAG